MFLFLFSLSVRATEEHWLSQLSVSCRRSVSFFSSQQDAVEENEQRKKQEQAMREKLLAEEAKQRDPKVHLMQLNWMNHTVSDVYSVLNRTLWCANTHRENSTNLLCICTGPGPEEEASAAGADRRAAQTASQRPPACVWGEGWHYWGHHHRWDGQQIKKAPRGHRQQFRST